MNGRLQSRVNKLRGEWCNPDECDNGPTVWKIDDGVSLTDLFACSPSDEAAAARCPKCGETHVQIIREVVVLDRAGAKAVLAMADCPDDTALPPGVVPSGVYRRDRDKKAGTR